MARFIHGTSDCARRQQGISVRGADILCSTNGRASTTTQHPCDAPVYILQSTMVEANVVIALAVVGSVVGTALTGLCCYLTSRQKPSRSGHSSRHHSPHPPPPPPAPPPGAGGRVYPPRQSTAGTPARGQGAGGRDTAKAGRGQRTKT